MQTDGVLYIPITTNTIVIQMKSEEISVLFTNTSKGTAFLHQGVISKESKNNGT